VSWARSGAIAQASKSATPLNTRRDDIGMARRRENRDAHGPHAGGHGSLVRSSCR
jgi:hypothetical protein